MTTLPGTSLDESMRLGELVREDLLKYPQVVSIDQRAGRSELDEDAQPPNFSEFDVRLDFAKDPTMSADELLEQIRERSGECSWRGVQRRPVHRASHGRGAVRRALAGRDQDLRRSAAAALSSSASRRRTILQAVPGAVDVNLEQQISVPQVNYRIDRDKAARYGIKVGDVAEDIQTSLNGETVSSVLEGRRSFDLDASPAERLAQQRRAIRDIFVDAPA